LSQVYKCSMSVVGTDSEIRAIKIVVFDDDDEMEIAGREAMAMLSLDNPNVLKTYEVFKYNDEEETTKRLCFVMEYYPFGDLDSYIR